MAEIKVIANLENVNYELSNEEGDVYTREIAAPEQDAEVNVYAEDESGNVSYGIEFLSVNMEWLPPKIDWTEDDYFNAIDYNRIIGNIDYLNNYAKRLFLDISSLSEKEEKDYKSMIYAREINTIEEEIEILNEETYFLDIGDKKTYKANGKVPDYNEYNRIESACLKIYNELKCHKENLPRLAFRLGNRNGIGGI